MRIPQPSPGCSPLYRAILSKPPTHPSVSPANPRPKLTFRVELRNVAELLLPRGHKGLDRHRLERGQVLLQHRSEEPGARLMVGVRASRRLGGNSSTQAFGGTNFGTAGQNIIGVAQNPST